MGLLNSLLFMLNEMSPYILLGFFIAGLMHAFVPQKTFARHLAGKEHSFSLLSTSQFRLKFLRRLRINLYLQTLINSTFEIHCKFTMNF